MSARDSMRLLLLIWALQAFAAPAYAELYFEQDVHAVRSGLPDGQAPQSAHYQRKIYLIDDLLAIQIVEGDRVQAEYGFDFSRNLYYEADPSTDYYKLFDLDLLDKAFARMGQEPPAAAGSAMRRNRRQMAQAFSEVLMEGGMDYPVHVSRSAWRQREIAGLQTHRYSLSAGPGSFILNPIGWYRKAVIWATTQSPGYEEYRRMSLLLNEKARFYKIKYNRASDFVTTMANLEAFPLEINAVAKRRFGRANAKETSREVTSRILNGGIESADLIYKKDHTRFFWHVMFSEGADFGREVSTRRSGDLKMRTVLAWSVVPALFLMLTFAWFILGVSSESRLSYRKLCVGRLYLLIGILFVIQILHFVSGRDYWVSPMAELSVVAIAGLAWILLGIWEHRRYLRQYMQERFLEACPHCHARIEKFYVVCPVCNKPLK